MNFGARTPEAEARRIVEAALAGGILAFDTANSYESGASERILGRALKGNGVLGLQVATKVGLLRVKNKPEGLAPAVILSSVRESRERLGRGRIDLLYLHAPDRATPIEESLGAVKELLDEGTIAAFGVSNFASWQILEIIHACRALGMPPPADSQVLYNVAVRQIELEYLAFADRYRLRTTVYNPLAGGLLTGRYEAAQSHPPESRLAKNRLYQKRYGLSRMMEYAHVTLAGIAARHGLGLIDLAYGFVVGAAGVDRVILGPALASHLDAPLAARPLSPAVLAELAAARLDHDGTDAVYARV